MTIEMQNIATRALVVSPNSQLVFGTVLADVNLTHRPRFDAAAFAEIGKSFYSDSDWGNKGHDFPTQRVEIERATSFQGSCPVSDYMAGWLVAQLLNAVTTTGAGPFNHVFKPLLTTRVAKVTTIYVEDTAAIKTKYPDLAGTELSLSYGPTGPVQAQITLMGSGNLTDAAMGATPAPVAAPTILLGSDTDYLLGPQGAPVSIKQYVRSGQVKITRDVEIFRAVGSGLFATQVNVNKTRVSASLMVRAKDTELAADPRSLFLGETIQELQINTNSGAAAQLKLKFPAVKVRTKPVADGTFVGWQVDITEDDAFKTAAGEIVEVTVINGQATWLVGA